MTEYCCSCKSPTKRQDSIWMKIRVFPLYNAVGFGRKTTKWRESRRLCQECFDLFMVPFVEVCAEENEALPPLTEEKKSSPCDACGEHLFKNDPYVNVEFQDLAEDFENNTLLARHGICYDCFEREFSPFTIDTNEALRKVADLSPRQSSNYPGLIRSVVGRFRGGRQ